MDSHKYNGLLYLNTEIQAMRRAMRDSLWGEFGSASDDFAPMAIPGPYINTYNKRYIQVELT